MTERTQPTAAPPAPPAATPTCATDHQLGTWRQSTTLPEEAAIRLVRHLAVPCDDLNRALTDDTD